MAAQSRAVASATLTEKRAMKKKEENDFYLLPNIVCHIFTAIYQKNVTMYVAKCFEFFFLVLDLACK